VARHRVDQLPGLDLGRLGNGCSTGPVLITDYNGDPTAYGAAYQAHLLSLAG